MADIASVLENQSNAAPDQDASGRAKEDTASQSCLVPLEGDDSVFYSEGEEIPQQTLDSIWAPRSGEPFWPEKPNSAPQIYNSGAQASCHRIGLMEVSSELDSVVLLKEMESKMENKVNKMLSTDTDVYVETADNSRIKHSEELSVPPIVPLRGSTQAGAAQMKERADSYTDESSDFLPDESRETGLPEASSGSLEEVEQEDGLDMMYDSNNKPFNHLMHAKYGTVSYRRIRRGQTKKRIEMFESMMQL